MRVLTEATGRDRLPPWPPCRDSSQLGSLYHLPLAHSAHEDTGFITTPVKKTASFGRGSRRAPCCDPGHRWMPDLHYLGGSSRSPVFSGAAAQRGFGVKSKTDHQADARGEGAGDQVFEC